MNTGVLSLWGNPADTQTITVADSPTLVGDYNVPTTYGGSAVVGYYISVETQSIRFGFGSGGNGHLIPAASDIYLTSVAMREKLWIKNAVAETVATIQITPFI